MHRSGPRSSSLLVRSLLPAAAAAFAGSLPAQCPLVFEPPWWTGPGMNSAVHVLAAGADGSVIAAGSFTTAAGVPCSRVARWNGAGRRSAAGSTGSARPCSSTAT
jgi:hypothetical protein